jgi:hypothetical protein
VKPNLANGYRRNLVEAADFGGNFCIANREKVRKLVLTELITQPHAEAEVEPSELTFRSFPKKLAVFRFQPLDKLLDVLLRPLGTIITFHRLDLFSWVCAPARRPGMLAVAAAFLGSAIAVTAE